MPIEIIHRQEGQLSQKQDIRHGNTQFSINSWGHLCIREFDSPKKAHCTGKGGYCGGECKGCDYYELAVPGEEHLVVLDKKTTEGLINFIFSVRSTFELKAILKDIIKSKDVLPF